MQTGQIKRAVFTYAVDGFWLEDETGERWFNAHGHGLNPQQRRQCVQNPGQWQTIN